MSEKLFPKTPRRSPRCMSMHRGLHTLELSPPTTSPLFRIRTASRFGVTVSPIPAAENSRSSLRVTRRKSSHSPMAARSAAAIASIAVNCAPSISSSDISARATDGLAGAVARQLLLDGFDSMLVWVLEKNPCRAFYDALGGIVVNSKMINIGGTEFLELAYGWSDIHPLVELS